MRLPSALYHCFEILILVHIGTGYHNTSNLPYHCWPFYANSSTPLTSCGGLRLEWVNSPPPDKIGHGQQFNVSYRATADQEFYSQSVAFPNHSESFVRELCGQSCPNEATAVDPSNCCVWHANIHTCHPSLTSSMCSPNPGVCGPWVANDGMLSTHTLVQFGPLNKTFTSVNIRADFEGVIEIIAHLKIGDIQLVLGKKILVEESTTVVCGDGLCETEHGETCVTCSLDCCLSYSVGFIIPLVLVSVATALVITLICRHKRKQFFDESWIISYETLRHSGPSCHPYSSGPSLARISSASRVNGRPISMAPAAPYGTSSSVDSTFHSQTAFTDIGIHEGRVVAIKMLKGRSIALTNTVRKEVLQIRLLDHPNICKFIGATLRDPTKQAIVTEYCPKGSLYDVLMNNNITLNWGFRFSFVSDIARGMSYLHHKRICHTRLTSTNCLIDNRWTIKVTDFGLPTLRSTNETLRSRKSSVGNLRLKMRSSSTECLNPSFPKPTLRIYQPPEVKDCPLDEIIPLPATDVYSFGVLLVEVATRMDLYALDKSTLNANLRPAIRLSDLTNSNIPCPCPLDYIDLIKRCWSQLAARRPTFELINKTLTQINPHKKSPVDMMMAMMEKYSKDLEALVAERTHELVMERNKTTNVLYSMLPKMVANDLIHGKPAPATSFSSATIFFSDIVGFTNLASSSTPMEIVRFLNELYTVFDSILDHFDVYKVETIGDAYMVVSGVPSENRDNHAGEIASMALELLSASQQFRIPHRPDRKLEIRAGIHTGPVCAGVVGMKMPRYCLFGDTVNTASRMESTSEAMKIQCSSATYELLMRLGGFHLESRGNISVKGKGLMHTWWLVGKLCTQEINLTFE